MILELAEALLRIPDDTTRDLLIFDKLASGHWSLDHLKLQWLNLVARTISRILSLSRDMACDMLCVVPYPPDKRRTPSGQPR